MGESVSLIKPTVDVKDEYLAFYQEWKQSGEQMVPWVISKDPSDFSAMVEELHAEESGENLPEGWVPASTYWLITEDKKIVGAVNIRHQLTVPLLQTGGHIGYGIRPSERRKGYATQILALSLQKAKELGIEKALVVCDATNLASERTILKNGGMADESFVEEDGNIVKRYWIAL
ncbi:GCN5 family N-acetyltransferase [Brevibacillus panacihumi W25]|uniref:GCN5 family N-acetyltransferase n=1 Tax=Brevibacillus panacihumi W25 TaxID=1408254 RepID=V6MDR5_9BACL|nr:GNAT family N-acetyltransferase [Brevibacillus panacihumi]EST56659.1 GCN5 family N-acetyltransferase [Brevibacillus panacihumi W25]